MTAQRSPCVIAEGYDRHSPTIPSEETGWMSMICSPPGRRPEVTSMLMPWRLFLIVRCQMFDRHKEYGEDRSGGSGGLLLDLFRLLIFVSKSGKNDIPKVPLTFGVFDGIFFSASGRGRGFLLDDISQIFPRIKRRALFSCRPDSRLSSTLARRKGTSYLRTMRRAALGVRGEDVYVSAGKKQGTHHVHENHQSVLNANLLSACPQPSRVICSSVTVVACMM